MGKEKGGFLTPKAIANRIKAKGLQKLRWFCQMCQKQCRDEVRQGNRDSFKTVSIIKAFVKLFRSVDYIVLTVCCLSEWLQVSLDFRVTSKTAPPVCRKS